MIEGDGADAAMIRSRAWQWTALGLLACASGLAILIPVTSGPHWARHAATPVVITYVGAVAAAFIAGCVRISRMGVQFGGHGITVRNFLRTRTVGWHEVSHLTDGSAQGGEAGDVWALNVVLRDGRVVTAVGAKAIGKVARPEMLEAIRQAGDRHGIPVKATGVAVTSGFYFDPGGHRGVRYWTGNVWSPLLPAHIAGKRPVADYPGEALLPPLEKEPGWSYARRRLRRRVPVGVLIYTLPLAGVGLWLDRRGTLGVGGRLALGSMWALFMLGMLNVSRFYLKLDRAARSERTLTGD